MTIPQWVVLVILAYLAMGVSTYTGVLLAWAQGMEYIDSHFKVAFLAIFAWPWVIFKVSTGLRKNSNAHNLVENKLTRDDDRDNMDKDFE